MPIMDERNYLMLIDEENSSEFAIFTECGKGYTFTTKI